MAARRKEPAVLHSSTILPAAPTMQANYRQIASTCASYQRPSLTTDGLPVAAPASLQLPAAWVFYTKLLAAHLPTTSLPAALHRAIALPAVFASNAVSQSPESPLHACTGHHDTSHAQISEVRYWYT